MDMTHETDKIVEIERQKVEVENERYAIEDECCSIRKRIDVLDGVAAQVRIHMSRKKCRLSETLL